MIYREWAVWCRKPPHANRMLKKCDANKTAQWHFPFLWPQLSATRTGSLPASSEICFLFPSAYPSIYLPIHPSAYVAVESWNHVTSVSCIFWTRRRQSEINRELKIWKSLFAHSQLFHTFPFCRQPSLKTACNFEGTLISKLLSQGKPREPQAKAFLPFGFDCNSSLWAVSGFLWKAIQNST